MARGPFTASAPRTDRYVSALTSSRDTEQCEAALEDWAQRGHEHGRHVARVLMDERAADDRVAALAAAEDSGHVDVAHARGVQAQRRRGRGIALERRAPRHRAGRAGAAPGGDGGV